MLQLEFYMISTWFEKGGRAFECFDWMNQFLIGKTELTHVIRKQTSISNYYNKVEGDENSYKMI